MADEYIDQLPALPSPLAAGDLLIVERAFVEYKAAASDLPTGTGNVNAGAALTSGSLIIGQGATDIAVTTTGANVITALGVAVGSAGAFITFNGAGGTPSSLVGTNITGTAAGLTAGTVTTNANITGDVTSVGNATTLATVNGNVGTFGSATQSPQVTVNAKGLITAISNLTITPALGSITGFGTNVATALAVNVGSAGAFITFNGAAGTPSSMVGTNITGTAAGLTAGNVTTNANLTGDVTSVGNATTLATVNGNVGTFGSATQASVVTVNAKGLVTAASNATVTPAVGSITGLGTGVATALAVNVGSAGAPVVLNGAGGTPSSLTGTNITGTAAGLTAGNVTTNANLTGPVTSTGNATTIAANVVTPAMQTVAGKTKPITFGKDGGGSALTVSTVATAITVDVTGTLIGYDISIDTGTITLKFWKIADGTAIPTIANVINTSGIAISSGTHIRSSTTSDFTTTTFTAGDIVMCAITAVSGATWFNVDLRRTVD